jgi:AraC-like DNA-binding protein
LSDCKSKVSDWKSKVTAEYEPTDAQRSLVESASAFGITQAEIATQLKISEPTLRKHFRDESADEQVRLRACQWVECGYLA